MSYDIYLEDAKGNEFVLDKPLLEGGTYKLGGNPTTHFNITYNYGWFYYKYLDRKEGIRYLYGKSGKDCISILEKVIEKFKDELPGDNYWNGRNIGNCVKPLKILLDWCKKYPKGIFRGD